MSPIYWGVDLIRELAKSGTGETKLAIARKALEDRWQVDRQHATAEELYIAMEGAGVGELTLSKARSLIENGTAFVVTAPKVNIEDLLPPPPPSPSETQFGTPPPGRDSQFGTPRSLDAQDAGSVETMGEAKVTGEAKANETVANSSKEQTKRKS